MRLQPLLAIFLAGPFFAVAQTAHSPEFAMQFQTIGAVVPSPDGKMAAWVQIRNVMEPERSEQVAQIFVGASDGSSRRQLTRNDKGSNSPQWAPDGKSVYFLSERGSLTQIYRIPIAGGEAEALTEFKGAVAAFAVSPDGKRVAFTGAEPPPDEEKAKKEKRDYRVVDANPANHQLYMIQAEPDSDGKRLQKRLFEAKYHIENFDWSPDSRSIAFEHWPTPLADNWTKADIGEVEVESGKVKDLAATGAAESKPSYSPDGRYVAFDRSSDPPHRPGDTRIVLLSRASGEVRELPATNDERPAVLGWAPDSRRLFFMEARRTKTALYEMPVDGPPRLLLEATSVIGPGAHLNASGTHAGLPIESSGLAPEAYVYPMSGAGPVRVSRANTDLPQHPLGKTEVITWKSKDGMDVEGLLTYPVNYEPGKKYPLILNIHGGPAGVFSETFIGRAGLYPIATFAAHGYAVLRPNPRGSGGYGKKFRYANVNDWGGHDFEDDQAGVDKVIAMGIADPDHMAVMGWSYGGFMTSWTITQTNRFKAAVVGAGVTDLWSFTGTSDIRGFLPDYFGGEPWQAFENFRKHSPITYVKNVKTPTLILHGEADVRVPISQGYEYYNALKYQGTTAKMVVYPRTPHGPREPKFILDIMQRHLDWVEKYAR